MPWTPSDAQSKTKKATTPAKQKQWSAVANAVLAKTGSDASAIRIANSNIGRYRSHGQKNP
jgi:uncharacterized protein YdaT